MACDFMSFSTVFQSYQDTEQMIMEGCVQWNPVYIEKISPRAEAGTPERQISRPALNPLSTIYGPCC